MRSLVAAFRFLTRVPFPGPDSRLQDLAPAVGWFPLVGAAVGLATAGAFELARHAWPPMVAAVLAVAFGLLLTGGFHEDGLTDAIDGLGGGGRDRERVVAIMKDSRIGAYGAMGLWCALSLRAAVLVALGREALWVLPLAMAWGRWSIAVVLRLLPPISEGLAKEVHRRQDATPLFHASALAGSGTALALFLGHPKALWLAPSALAMALLWAWRLKRRLGGQSGDLLGACAMLAEAACLLTWLAA
jgi:adenosylcobinamide-GDP ribazoletransferase